MAVDKVGVFVGICAVILTVDVVAVAMAGEVVLIIGVGGSIVQSSTPSFSPS